MNVGIYTRWQRRDSTYAAIQIAELMSQWQHDVTILTPTPKRPLVSNFWDGRVRHDAQVRFTDWAAKLAVVIWLFYPPPEQVNWTNKAGKRTILVPGLDDASVTSPEEVIPLFWRIMAPTRRWERLFDVWGMSNAMLCPWSPMLPITLRVLTRPVRVYMPPAAGTLIEEPTIDIIEAMFELDRSVEATISIDGYRGAIVKRLERLAKARPRLTLARPEDYHRQVLRFGEHSLTLLAAVSESFGMPALCSLHMGTPVFGFVVPPLPEMTNTRNAVLVERKIDKLDLLETLMTLVEGPELAKLFAGCPSGLELRRGQFEVAWTSVVAR